MGAGGVVFLVNPASANGSTGRRWPEIARRAAVAGLVGDAFLSERSGHVAELARRACEEGASLVVAVGGDGTVHETVNGLMAVEPTRRAELATVPRGTGKDFARSLGIPAQLDRAVLVAREGVARTVDVGRATYVAWDGSGATAYFANFAGAGISGAIARRANDTSKLLGGKLSFFRATVAVFVCWKSAAMTADVDGTRREGQMFEMQKGPDGSSPGRPDRNPPWAFEDLARNTGGGFMQVEEVNGWQPPFTEISLDLHSQYILGFTPARLDGRAHSLDVKVHRAGLIVRARRNYLAVPDAEGGGATSGGRGSR